MTTPHLEIINIRKSYGNVHAVKNVNLEIEKGEFMTLLGPSGSGKSTTLYMISGLQDPTSGEIRIGGESILPVPPNRRNIGMVFQRYTLFPNMTVYGNVAFPLKVRKLPKVEIEKSVRRVLKLVRLDQFGDRMPAQLSGGQQQRVALARALAYDPPLLLMDEPLSALDKKLREEIQFEIKRIHQETGVTILYVTHDQEEALRLSTRIALFNEGEIEQVGRPTELYTDPATKYVADFMGNSNFLPGVVKGKSGDRIDIEVSGLVVENVKLCCNCSVGDHAQLLLRPERLALTMAKPSGVALPATVDLITFLGNSVQIDVRASCGTEMVVRLQFGHPSLSGLKAGSAVWLGIEPETAHAFPKDATSKAVDHKSAFWNGANC